MGHPRRGAHPRLFTRRPSTWWPTTEDCGTRCQPLRRFPAAPSPSQTLKAPPPSHPRPPTTQRTAQQQRTPTPSEQLHPATSHEDNRVANGREALRRSKRDKRHGRKQVSCHQAARAPPLHHRPQAGRKESRPTQTNTARRKMRNPARVISPVQARSKRAVPTRSLCPGPFHASMKPQRSTCTRVTSPPSSSSSPRGATV